MKSFRMPTAYTILLSLLLVMTILTWVIPAGRYQTGPEGEPVAGTYEQIPQQGQPITSVFTAPLEGLYEAIDIAAFILMVGGFLGVVGKTGAIDRGISALVAKLRGKETLLIPILMLVFALGGTTFGMAEETIAFYPLVLPIFISAGYDPITAVAVILVGAGVGTLASTVNPFATGIAAGFAGVSLGTGMLLRVVHLLCHALRRPGQSPPGDLPHGQPSGRLHRPLRRPRFGRGQADLGAISGPGPLCPHLPGDDLRRHPL